MVPRRVCDLGNVLVVPRGCCWLEGDNPDHSRDSNAFGTVNENPTYPC